MYILYLDEFGHDGIWDPAQPNHCHHPLFGLAGHAIPGNRARDLDRGYLRLKLQFYSREIADAEARGERPERFEPKQLSSRRDFIFAMEVVNLIRRLDGHVFAQGVSKVTGKKTGSWLYNSVAGRMLVAFERYLRARGGIRDGCGVIVLDRRDEIRDVKLLGSLQSFLFSRSASFARISETPLLVRSEWYHGVQAADTIARSAGSVYRKRYFAQGKGGVRLESLGDLLDRTAHTTEHGPSVRVTRPHRSLPPVRQQPAASDRRSRQPRDRGPLSQPVLTPAVVEKLGLSPPHAPSTRESEPSPDRDTDG